MSGLFGATAFTGALGEVKDVPNLIQYFFSDDIIKALFYTCLRIDIPDNNMKAEVVKKILGLDFEEIGTGTNRIALLHNGVIVKIALDRRGLVDNYQEFKRSIELESYLAKTYETNFVINICQYVEVMDQDTFLINQKEIKTMLREIAKNYLFDDIGFTMKNSYNWGMREARLTPEERYELEDIMDEIYDICILDYGYLYPLNGQKDKVLRCPRCSHRLEWNMNFTSLACSNSQCKFTATPMQIRGQMKLDFENMENALTTSLMGIEMPNLTKIEQAISAMKRAVMEQEAKDSGESKPEEEAEEPKSDKEGEST